MDNNTQAEDFEVRILDSNGTIKEIRKVHYNPLLLTRNDVAKLRRMVNMRTYVNVDPSKIKKGMSIEEGAQALSGVSIGDFYDGIFAAENECALIVFGLRDIGLDNIPNEDFEPLYAFTKEKDLLQFARDEDDFTKKKLESTSPSSGI